MTQQFGEEKKRIEKKKDKKRNCTIITLQTCSTTTGYSAAPGEVVVMFLRSMAVPGSDTMEPECTVSSSLTYVAVVSPVRISSLI